MRERMLNSTFRSLRIRNYRLFFIGQGISMSGFWMQSVAEAWLVLRLTGSGAALGTVAALNFLPMLVLGPWGGVLADRLDKRRLLIVTQAVMGILAFTLGLLVATDAVRLWMVFVLAFVLGIASAIDNPTRRSFVYELVDGPDRSNAASLVGTQVSVSRVIGPALAGVLIGTVGLASCFFVNAASFVAVIGALVLIDGARLHRVEPPTRAKGQVREGMRYAWRTPAVRLPLAMMAVLGTFAFNFQVVFPLLSRGTFGAGPQVLGVFFALAAIGSICGSLVMASRPRVTSTALCGAAIFFGGAILLASTAPSLGVALVAVVPVGAGGAAFLSAGTAVLQVEVEGRMQGRVMALWAVLFLGTTPIGGPLAGVVAELASPRVAFAMGGFAALCTGTLALWWTRRNGTVTTEHVRPSAVLPPRPPTG